MDLTLRRQPQGTRHRAQALRGLAVPAAALGGAVALSAGLLLVLSDLVARLG